MSSPPALEGRVAVVTGSSRGIGREDDVVAMVERTVGEFGRLDILVNNAGALWWKPLLAPLGVGDVRTPPIIS